jgi:hypothetical protein
MLTPEKVRELNERSKDDHAMIVGSEVRQLCGALLTAATAIDMLETTLQEVVDADTVSACSGYSEASKARYAKAISNALNVLVIVRRARGGP